LDDLNQEIIKSHKKLFALDEVNKKWLTKDYFFPLDDGKQITL
jgi:hypothetical protein